MTSRRQSERSSAIVGGRGSDPQHYRAGSVDLLQAHKYLSGEHGLQPGPGGEVAGGYGGGSDLYQAEAGAGSTENEYAYVWETVPADDDPGTPAHRIDYFHADPVMRCPQKRRPPFASRQTSLAPPGEYETTGIVAELQNFDDTNKQFA